MSKPFTLIVDSEIYPIRIVQRAAYALAAEFTILIKRENHNFELEIAPLKIGSDKEAISSDFIKSKVITELNDFAVRDRIQQETSGIRELLAKAALRECGV